LVDVIQEIGAFAGLAAFLGLAILALLAFTQGRDIRRLREWAGSAPERDTERKEATSAVAAQRAEELRRLDEARTAEQEAAELREERRRRREAGLPELTRSERLRQSLSSRGRLSEPLYLVGIFLIGMVLAGGIAYAALHGFGDDGGGNGKKNHGGAKLKPSEIEVTVLNGTAVPGLAKEYGEKLENKNFRIGTVTNSSSSFEESVVMYERGSAPEARRVAKELGIQDLQLMTTDVESVSGGAPVSVIVGEDNASSAG
jgi:hypothetical protein